MVYMIDLKPIGRIEDFPVHPHHPFWFAFFAIGPSGGIKRAVGLVGIPFIAPKASEIGWIDDGVFAAC